MTIFSPPMSIAARWILSTIFVVSGMSKLMFFDDTVLTIVGYDIIGISMAHLVAWGAIIGEIALALWLASGRRPQKSLLVTIVVFIFFIMLIASAWARGLSIECGCFGGRYTVPEDPVKGYIVDIIRDIAMMSLAVMGYRAESRGGSMRSEMLTTDVDGATVS